MCNTCISSYLIIILQHELEDSQKSLDGVRRTKGTLAKEKEDAIQRCRKLQVSLSACVHMHISLHVHSNEVHSGHLFHGLF